MVYINGTPVANYKSEKNNKMQKKMILLFSHKLTKPQIKEAKSILKIDEFVSLPYKYQKKWSNIPTHLDDISDYLQDITNWLNKIIKHQDYILIQGEFGAAHYMVNFAIKNKLTPVYSTTKRVHKEIQLSNGEVEIKKIFQHIMFRKYPSKQCRK